MCVCVGGGVLAFLDSYLQTNHLIFMQCSIRIYFHSKAKYKQTQQKQRGHSLAQTINIALYILKRSEAN